MVDPLNKLIDLTRKRDPNHENNKIDFHGENQPDDFQNTNLNDVSSRYIENSKRIESKN